jgi:Mn-dependent DtxR family transcriptional regulator
MPKPTANSPEAQEAVLRFIQQYKADPKNDGNSPTYREIAAALGKTHRRIYTICQRLQERGLIEINARGKIVLVGGKYEPYNVPLFPLD